MDYEESLFDDDLTVIPVDAVAACAAAFAEVEPRRKPKRSAICKSHWANRSQVLNASLGPKGFIGDGTSRV